MDKEIVKKYIESGKIHKEIRKKAQKSIKVGEKLLDVAERIEKDIVDLKALPAFPVNLSTNNEAAHYTPSHDDEKVIGEKDVLKVDIGVHIDGFISDSAFTLDFSGEYGKMIDANEEALENAISLLKPGVEIAKVSEEIENTIKKHGFNPVANLTGHGLDEYTAHTSPSIPNVSKKGDTRTLDEGMAFAIEPFVSNGEGWVRESSKCEIFELGDVKPTRNQTARELIEFIVENYDGLPFAERWIVKNFDVSEFKRKIAFRELLRNGSLETHPILKEEEGKIVTQAETCFVIFEGEVIRLV